MRLGRNDVPKVSRGAAVVARVALGWLKVGEDPVWDRD